MPILFIHSLFIALAATAWVFLNLFTEPSLIALMVFGVLERVWDIPAFQKVVEVLTDDLKLIIGAISGAFSAEGAKHLKRYDGEGAYDLRTESGEHQSTPFVEKVVVDVWIRECL